MKIAIAGAGKLGLRVTEILKGGNHSVLLIDKDEELIDKLSVSLDVAAACGNAKEASMLEEIGISDYDYLITATDKDEKNIVIAATAKKLGVKNVIARIRDPEYDNQENMLKEVFGIDYIINPERSVAEEINKYLVEKYSFKGGILNAGRISLLEIQTERIPEIIGRMVSRTDEILKDRGMSLAAVSRNGKLMIKGGDADEEIREGDVLFLVGDRERIKAAGEKIIDRVRHTDIQRIMIAGGGKIGFYLTRLIEEYGVAVKIIESDIKRCNYLAEHLPNALILNGDATDISLLEEEDFNDMHAFVSVTGIDEVNLLLALMAKQAGIEDVIAKISRENFGELITGMGVDMVLNPVDISANYIVRNIEDTLVLTSKIIQGQAEFLCIVVGQDMIAEGRDIENLNLPQGLEIIAVQRGMEVILPDAKTKIKKGNRLAILSLLSESFDLEKLLKTKHGFFS